MTPEQQAALRAEFPAEQVGKLPKPTKKENPKGKCDVCGGWHGLPAIHLDYVGHAAVTDRILSVDPEYTFGPVLDVNGLPVTRGPEMLHYLTICGVTRHEWGEGPNMKEISSDAIRRCAMRFGVALDLWAKESLQGADGDEAAAPRPTSPPRRAGRGTPTKAWKDKTQAQRDLLDACKEAKIDAKLRHRICMMLTGHESTEEMSDEECEKVTGQVAWFQMNRSAGMEALADWEARNLP